MRISDEVFHTLTVFGWVCYTQNDSSQALAEMWVPWTYFTLESEESVLSNSSVHTGSPGSQIQVWDQSLMCRRISEALPKTLAGR